MNRRHFMALAAATSMAGAGPAFAEDIPLTVVATTGMIADAARQVGGEHVMVKALMGPGVDPHAYRQTRTDIVALTRADAVLWHGLYLEAQMEELLLDLTDRQLVTAVGEGVATSKLIAHEDYDGRFDPHVWMVPELWADVVRSVTATLTTAAPQHAEYFEANAAGHLVDLERLGDYAQTSLTTVPEEARVLLTAHDAFGYFGKTYGFDVVGIQGISTESEAGLDRIAELVDMLATRDIRAVFVESSVSDRNVRALIEGAADRKSVV